MTDTAVVKQLAKQVAERGGRVTFLTGAGVSAESGIPTFRGRDGFWTVGSVNYRPEQLATRRHFSSDPGVVWPWYLYRLAACRKANPNPGHLALADLESKIGGLFRLVTQNVDGLHVRAGSDPNRTFHIHGNLEWVRCADACTRQTSPIASQLREFAKGESLTDQDKALLTCGRCGSWLRPHVLWFDEMYDEEWFFYDSASRSARDTDLLVVVGTSGETNLPIQMGMIAMRSGVPIIDMNLSRSPFTELAEASGGLWMQGRSGELLPILCDALGDAIHA